jgi:kinesin family protein 13
MGISVQASGIGVQTDKYYLINLNADPSMNELLVCYLKDSTRIGRPGHTVTQVGGCGWPRLDYCLGHSIERFGYS